MDDSWPETMRSLSEREWTEIRDEGVHVDVDRVSGKVIMVTADGMEAAYGRTAYLAYRKLRGR